MKQVVKNRRRRKNRASRRGVALIMVMAAIAVLTVMLTEFQDDVSSEAAAAISERDAVQAEYYAKSAINLGRLLIASEPTIRSALAPIFMLMKRTPPQVPVWEFSDRILGIFNDADGADAFAGALKTNLSAAKNLGLGGGKFELVIVDEDSKINANLGASNDIAHIRLAQQIMGLLTPIQYDPLFQKRDKSGQFSDRLATCAALIDWADNDESAFNCDLKQISGAQNAGVEDAWYQLLPRPYRRKNAPYDSLEELRMVRGASDDFFATFVDPDSANPKKRIMTVWGQGAINVNTANAQTLYAVVCAGAPAAELCVDPNQAALFLTGVTMARGLTMGAPLFGSTRDFIDTMQGKGMIGPLLAGMGMKPVKFKSDAETAKSITIESKVFSIYAVGIKKGYKRETRVRVQAVVDFRSAPSVTGAAPASGQTGTAASRTSTPGAGSASALAAATQPQTGGQVVYYRVE